MIATAEPPTADGGVYIGEYETSTKLLVTEICEVELQTVTKLHKFDSSL